jgi:hypothetical protein
MLGHLDQQATLKDVTSALEEIPDGIDGVYNRILQKISSLPSSRHRIVQRILQLVLSATRSLSILEMEVALAAEPGSPCHDLGNSVPKLAKFVRECCSPLLEIDTDLREYY